MWLLHCTSIRKIWIFFEEFYSPSPYPSYPVAKWPTFLDVPALFRVHPFHRKVSDINTKTENFIPWNYRTNTLRTLLASFSVFATSRAYFFIHQHWKFCQQVSVSYKSFFNLFVCKFYIQRILVRFYILSTEQPIYNLFKYNAHNFILINFLSVRIGWKCYSIFNWTLSKSGTELFSFIMESTF